MKLNSANFRIANVCKALNFFALLAHTSEVPTGTFLKKITEL